VLRTADFGTISEKYREYVADINQSGGHLLALIRDILDVSKAEAGEIEIDEPKFDLHLSIHEPIRMVQDQAERKGVDLTTVLSPGEVNF
tara:strand:+ start:664 stop:930 length:267 start_codon:yes stop_codon:yes gene_type:complete